jgi:protoporphyrinogen oxidase
VAWKQTRTAFYYHGKRYAFGAPWDLLFFSPVPWMQRLRFGFHILRSRYRKHWRWLDRIPAQPWLIENIGEQAYDVIWHPLLRIKFGDDYSQISAAWVWHRIWRVAKSRRHLWERESFGSLRAGSQTIIDGLLSWLKQQPGFNLCLGAPAAAIEWQDGRTCGVRLEDGSLLEADAVISTMALSQLERLLPGLETSGPEAAAFMANLHSIRYIGVVCMVLQLKQPFSSHFWTNINDPHISFNGVIEQTNLNDDLCRHGLHILYIPFYLPTSQPRFSASKEELLAEYLPMLKQVNPAFDASWIEESHVFRTPYAQAVCTTGFADQVPPLTTP